MEYIYILTLTVEVKQRKNCWTHFRNSPNGEEIHSFVTLQRHAEGGLLVETESLTQLQFTKTVGCDVKCSSFV